MGATPQFAGMKERCWRRRSVGLNTHPREGNQADESPGRFRLFSVVVMRPFAGRLDDVDCRLGFHADRAEFADECNDVASRRGARRHRDFVPQCASKRYSNLSDRVAVHGNGG